MNILDIVILFIMAVCMLNGAYNGFILSALHAASFFLSWMIAAIFYPMLSKFIVSRFPRLLSTTAFYVDGSSRIGNVENKMAKIGSFSKDQLSHVMEKTALPNPFFRILKSNIFKSANGTKALGEFFDTTMATIVIHIISFLLLFLATKLILNIVINTFKTVRDLPVLKQLDGVAGMGFGLISGIFLIYMLFALVPILMTIAPANIINEFLDGSLFAKFFYTTNVFTNLIRGSL